MAFDSFTSSKSTTFPLLLICVCVLNSLVKPGLAGNFNQEFDVSWGDGRAKILNNGQLLTLSLDKASGSGVQSKQEYLFGRIDMQLKLVPGNSAGTVTTYYLSSQGTTHDEIDLEFLGNLSGDPYVLHTNVYTQGQGGREQQFYLWFDPTADFHIYSIIWNSLSTIFFVDGTPIRVFKNLASKGIPYPNNQPMRIYASLWDAEGWATRGGLVKTDWSQAPFIASFRNFQADACVWTNGKSSCGSNSNKPWFSQQLDSTGKARLQWVQKNYMIYNYCTDAKRFPQGFPPECTAVPLSCDSNFYQDFDIIWGDNRGNILNNGELLTLSLDNTSGAGFQSKKEFLFGKFDMQIKLVPGNSAGTATAYYLSSQGPFRDEIDFEFLGNLSGEPYIAHTNVYTQGKGEREQQFCLWFDPTADFHTYSIHWNLSTIIFAVDNIPIREFKNLKNKSVPFPKNQTMKLYSSIWNADEWATRGGLVKIDWTQAPFIAAYRGFCATSCRSSMPHHSQWQLEKLKWVQENYMIYNYCTDTKRFPQGFPPECQAIS